MKFGSMKTIHEELKDHRLKVGDISLKKYMQEKFSATPEELYSELNINPHTTTVEMLFSISEHTKYIAPEIIRDAIILGMQIRRFKDRIITKSVKEKGTVIDCPYIDFSQIKSTKDKKRTPAATILEDSITYGTKYIKLQEFGKGIKFPYRYSQLRRLKIDLLPLYFQAVGIRIENDFQDKLIDIILNGEGGRDENDAVVDESAMVIGVDDTGAGITEDDYLRAVILMNIAGKPVDSMITSDVICKKAMKWDTFKKQLTGPEDTRLKIDIPLPSQLNTYPVLNTEMSNKMTLMCTRLGIIEHVFQPLQVEADLIINKRIEEAYATIEAGFSIVYRSFRIVIDGGTTYNENQVLPWLFY